MRLIIQRVTRSQVIIGGKVSGAIGKGLLILIGVEELDGTEDIEWLVKKTVNMRIFPDEEGKMNLSGLQSNAEYLVISQFTLHASTKKGNRPSFIKSAAPEKANALYEAFVQQLQENTNQRVETGQFGAEMQVELINDGPVTIFIDSRQRE